MNKFDGQRMNEVFTKYYDERELDPEDKPMLDMLQLALQIEFVLRDNKVFARASETGRGLNYRPSKNPRP
ncbi:MAG: hypothetical protein FWH47_05500 [Methanomassiliicoccaceae archaeon]|nr:hypothetical protein [Methanomassiliicoccaceae archaeon]